MMYFYYLVGFPGWDWNDVLFCALVPLIHFIH
jgi:hypothetical protein